MQQRPDLTPLWDGRCAVMAWCALSISHHSQNKDVGAAGSDPSEPQTLGGTLSKYPICQYLTVKTTQAQGVRLILQGRVGYVISFTCPCFSTAFLLSISEVTNVNETMPPG